MDFILTKAYNIQNTSKQAMYSRFYQLNNMDLISCHDLDQVGNASPGFGKAVVPTGADDACQEMDFLYQKSNRNLPTGFEISFEKGFMKEHQAVFERQLQNFMESDGTSQKLPSTNLTFDHFPAPKAQITIHDTIRNSNLGLSTQKIDQLSEKLMDYDKLEEFLDIVVNQTEGHLLYELIDLSAKLIDTYEEIKKEEPSNSELVKLSTNIARSANIQRLIAIKTTSSFGSIEQIVAKEKAQKFLEAFCATTILVIAQYFVNPYSDDEDGGFKRPLTPWSLEESEEENFEPTMAKKRKFSF